MAIVYSLCDHFPLYTSSSSLLSAINIWFDIVHSSLAKTRHTCTQSVTNVKLNTQAKHAHSTVNRLETLCDYIYTYNIHIAHIVYVGCNVFYAVYVVGCTSIGLHCNYSHRLSALYHTLDCWTSFLSHGKTCDAEIFMHTVSVTVPSMCHTRLCCG